MLDAPLRKIIDPPLAMAAVRLSRLPVSANALTAAALVTGGAAFWLIAAGRPLAGLAFIVVNRTLGGLDGPVARLKGASDLDAFLEIVFDFLFYASVPLAFAIADPSRSLAAAFLIFSLAGSGTTCLAFTLFAAKRGLSTETGGRKTFYFPGGLTEGTETVVAFAVACIFPDWFGTIAYVFGVLCFITMGTRVAAAVEAFR